MRPQATLQGMVGYSLQAGQNPFRGRTRPAGRMLPMPGLHGVNQANEVQVQYLDGFGVNLCKHYIKLLGCTSRGKNTWAAEIILQQACAKEHKPYIFSMVGDIGKGTFIVSP